MKLIIALLFVVSAVPLFGQDSKPVPANSDNSLAANWSKLGPTTEGSRGFTLHGKGVRLNGQGQYELWIKIVPTNAAAFGKRYDLPKGTAHVLQYATVDCNKRVVLLEKTSAYDSTGAVLAGSTSALTPSARKSTVKPGSVSEAVFRYVCLEPTSLPMVENRE